jgi:hypothetical protein
VPEPSDYWADFAERLDRLGIEAKLIGALAADLYRATPRSTTDADFLARSLDGLVDDLEADGYDCRVMRDVDGGPYAIFIRGHDQRIDVLLAETEYQRLALDRAQGPAITAEDVIVHKLLAWRARDRDDIEQILRGSVTLDRDYIDEWAKRWEVTDRWAEARRFAD